MNIQDILSEEAIANLKKVRQLAQDNLSVIQKFIDNGFPYTEHLAKAKEQADVIQRIFDVFEIE